MTTLPVVRTQSMATVSTKDPLKSVTPLGVTITIPWLLLLGLVLLSCMLLSFESVPRLLINRGIIWNWTIDK